MAGRDCNEKILLVSYPHYEFKLYTTRYEDGTWSEYYAPSKTWCHFATLWKHLKDLRSGMEERNKSIDATTTAETQWKDGNRSLLRELDASLDELWEITHHIGRQFEGFEYFAGHKVQWALWLEFYSN
ncbi:MAG: hypothetical protein Q9170_005832 [Blastenia crenularia]